MIILKPIANLSAEMATRFHAVHDHSPKAAAADSWHPKPGIGKYLNQIENIYPQCLAHTFKVFTPIR